MIEFLPWYEAGRSVMRCLSCGAHVSDGDTELHVKWHERIEPAPAKPFEPGLTTVVHGTGNAHGECSLCPGRGRPCNGPHDCSKM